MRFTHRTHLGGVGFNLHLPSAQIRKRCLLHSEDEDLERGKEGWTSRLWKQTGVKVGNGDDLKKAWVASTISN